MIKYILLGLANVCVHWDADLLDENTIGEAVIVTGNEFRDLNDILKLLSVNAGKNASLYLALKKADTEGRIAYSAKGLAYINAIMVHNSLQPIRPNDEKLDMGIIAAAFTKANPQIEMTWEKV